MVSNYSSHNKMAKHNICDNIVFHYYSNKTKYIKILNLRLRGLVNCFAVTMTTIHQMLSKLVLFLSGYKTT